MATKFNEVFLSYQLHRGSDVNGASGVSYMTQSQKVTLI